MKLLITGGCGFLGSNLASEALRQQRSLCVFDNLSRQGGVNNLAWLQSQGDFKFVSGDIRNQYDLCDTIKMFRPDCIFHLAGQVAMTTSIENPRLDFDVNASGTLNVLEAARQYSPHARIIYASTNKVYGDLEEYTYDETDTRYLCEAMGQGWHENIPLNFQSPYGCSKGAADQYMMDYARIFGMNTTVLRHSSIYGSRQFSTSDQGWVGWFCQQAVEACKNPDHQPFTIAGSGKQVRDLLHVEDAIELYFKAASDQAGQSLGQVYNVGGGMRNSLSLLELFNRLENLMDIPLSFTRLPARVSDQKVFVANLHKVSTQLNWRPKVNVEKGIEMMLDWVKSN